MVGTVKTFSLDKPKDISIGLINVLHGIVGVHDCYIERKTIFKKSLRLKIIAEIGTVPASLEAKLQEAVDKDMER